MWSMPSISWKQLNSQAVSARDDWEVAAEDAGIEPDAVFLVEARSKDASYGAMHYPPGMWALPWDDAFELAAEVRQELYDRREEHAIVVDRDASSPLRILLLRHEAEHVVQDLFLPAIGQVGVRLQGILGPQFYAAQPHERDADSAATALRRKRSMSVDEEESQGPNRLLYNAPWDEPDPKTLPVRMLAFSLFNPEGFDIACRGSQGPPQVDPDPLLDELVAGGSTVRRALRDRFATEVEERLQTPYSEQDAWDALGRQERNRIIDELRGRLVDEEARVLQAVREELAALAQTVSRPDGVLADAT